ncbi:rhomboid family intramembrane serine protease [Psychroflexus sediminis]|uniref:Membrane associated serine protease, rhomboid family n=1 Tax=Psychroflexus sediminis TaxID=470826 RepID=A0A1G7XGK4_9FLAO|nr:rhomboid family intramembrane serine protease [Psychroflexus sediminis]SDG83368.1 Membrane associated serine protease, rhomboid family [Psychroflexus sediminis]
MDWKQKITYKYNTADTLEKLIGINVALFILTFVFRTLGFLFKIPTDFFVEWLVFPKGLLEFAYKPWTIITYAFMHSGIFHILSNMLILYFSGKFFLTFFSGKRMLNLYFLGAISGALIYALSYNLLPAFSETGRSYLIGASASVMAILVAIATQSPNLEVRLFFLGNLKLWWIAAFLVVLDVVQIPISNPGGHLAHLGGSAIGYLYITQLNKGNDIGAWLQSITDWFADYFKPKTKKGNMKTVHKTSRKKQSKTTSRTDNQKKIDLILDKISKSGYDSLSKEEKDFLFKAGKDM